MAIDKLRRLELWARLGFAARGFVYLLLGWIALSTGRGLSTDDVVAEVERLPLAPVLLAVLAAGLFGYALFKLYSAAIDLDHKGDDHKGRVIRLFGALGGLAYIGLGGGQVDLVDHRHDLMVMLDALIDVGEGLRLDPLRRIDHQQRALARG